MSNDTPGATRRDFVKTGVAAGAALAMAPAVATSSAAAAQSSPATLFAAPPLEKVRIGFVGVGGMGSVHVENLLLIKDRRIAVSYMIQALTLFDHYYFRVLQAKADASNKPIQLKKAPSKPGEKAWWDKDYTDERKILDRELFA